MSLIHHWPLVDGLKDIISRVPLTGDSTETIGKIGPCRELNEQYLQVTNSSLKDLSVFSVSMWFKYSSAKAAWTDIFGLEIQNNVSSKSLRLEITSVDGTSAGLFNNGILTNSGGAGKYLTLTKDKWHHFVLTKDNELIQYFLDGAPIHQYRFLDVTGCSDGWCTGEFHLGDEKYNYKGCFSDVRIYDHVLSQAEISELAKALAVHYTFDDRLAETTTNLLHNQLVSFGELTIYLTQSLQHKVYTLTSSTLKPNFDTGTIRFKVPLSILTDGQVYYFSYKYKMLSGEGSRFEISDWCDVAVTEKTDIDCGDYRCVSARCYVDPTKREYNDTYRFMDFLMNPNTSVQVWDIQLQSSSTLTQYTSSTRLSKLYNEIGGVQPDKTQTKNITTIQDSAIGTYSLKCDQTAIATPLVADIDQGVTISCWVKTPDYPGGNAVVFADTNSKLAFGFYGSKNAIISCANYSTKVITNLKEKWEEKGLNEWQHLVLTRNPAGVIECWLNGKKIDQSAETTSNHWSQNKEALIIGARYNGSYGPHFSGYVDDFRVYQTALSEDDILDLYNTKAYLSNAGDWNCNQFIEHDLEGLVDFKGRISARSFEEFGTSIPSEYERTLYIENTSGQYVDTGYYWTTENATIIADLELLQVGASQTLFGSEEYIQSSGTSRYFAHILHCAGSQQGETRTFGAWCGTGSMGSVTLPLNERILLNYIVESNGTFSIYSNDVPLITQTAYNGSIQTKKYAYLTNYTYNNIGNIFIFGNHNSNRGAKKTGYQPVSKMRLYGFKMYDNDVQVRDFVPCIRKTDQKAGLYDLITKSFYPEIENGTFNIGLEALDEEYAFINDELVYGREIIEI